MHYSANNLPSPHHDIADVIETFDLDTSSKREAQALEITRGLMYLGVGCLDQCHNIVTPLSYPSTTAFAGPPQKPEAEIIRQNACYAHAMTHIREGLVTGEYGTGYCNAKYWYDTTGSHPLWEVGFSPDALVHEYEEAATSRNKELVEKMQSRMLVDWEALLMHCAADLAVLEKG